MLQVGASQYMAALIIGFVNSATIQVAPSGCQHVHITGQLAMLPAIGDDSPDTTRG